MLDRLFFPKIGKIFENQKHRFYFFQTLCVRAPHISDLVFISENKKLD